jgi:hypothetical protein
MTLYQLSIAFLPVPLGLAAAFLAGVIALRPRRFIRPRSARRMYDAVS